MGITYDELKKLKGNSVVLEREENIEIEQNANNFIRRKHTIVREKFPRQKRKEGRAKECKKSGGEYLKEPLNETTARALLNSLILEREEQKKIGEKLEATFQHLKVEFQHDIKNLKQEQSLIKMSLKPEATKAKKIKYIVLRKHDKTWSENLRDNETIKRPQEEVKVEKYSQEHKCVCTSPRYTSNEDVAVRPKMRTVALQISTPKCCADKGAVGDHNSINASHLKNENVRDNTPINLKEFQLKPLDPSLAKATPKDFLVNCCYGTTCCAASKPCHALCQRYCMARECNGIICNQQTYQETGVTPQREYKYCRDEIYYDYPNSPRLNTTQTPCICAPQCRFMNTTTTTNKIYGRPCSDLNTDQFYSRPTDRSGSPKTHSTSKSKRDANLLKKNEASLKAKPAKEKKQETCEEYGLRKQRECEEKHKRKIERSKSRERSKRKDAEEELVKLFDRFADEKDTKIDTFLRYLAEAKNQLSDESSETPKKCAEKSCQISMNKKCTCPKHSPNIGLNSLESMDGNGSRKSQFPMEALQMLKKMKLREYKPVQPSHKEVTKFRKCKTKTKETAKAEDEKSKRYKEYINKYNQEDEEDTEENSQNSKKQPTKEPISTLQPQPVKISKQQPSKKQNQKNFDTDDEDVVERYAYGPAVGNGWDDYGRGKYDDDTSISKDKKVPYNTSKREKYNNYGYSEDLKNKEAKSKHDLARTRQSIDESVRQSEYKPKIKRDSDDSKYTTPRARRDDRYESYDDERHYDKYRTQVDKSKGPVVKDERENRTKREINYDQITGSPRYSDHYNSETKYRSDEYPLKSQRDHEDIKHNLPAQPNSLSPYEKGNFYQNPSPSRGSYEAYDNRNQTKQTAKYQDQSPVNLHKPVKSEFDNYPMKHEEQSQRAGYETQHSQRSSFETKPFEQQRQGENYARSQQENSRFKYKDTRQYERERNYDQTSGSPRHSDHYNSETKYRSDEYPLKPQRDHEDIKHYLPAQPDSLSPYEKGNFYQNPSPSRGSFDEYENRNQTKQTAKYQDQSPVNLHKPVKSEFDNYPMKHEEQSQRAGYETQHSQRSSFETKPFEQQRQGENYARSQQENSRFKYKDTRQDERERNYDQTSDSPRHYDHYNSETKYRSDEYPLRSQRDHEDIKHNLPTQPDAFSPYERGNFYQNPSPSRGSFDEYENRNQTKQTAKYQDQSPVNLPKPVKSEYDNYPIKHEEQSHKAGYETQHTPRSSFETKPFDQQRQDVNYARSQQESSRFKYKDTSHSQLIPGESATKLYSSYDDIKQNIDGSRPIDALSKTGVTDQDSFRTYTKSTEISNAEQREEIPTDTRFNEDFSAPSEQYCYSKYKQQLRTKYTQAYDGTEVTHTDEEITIDETYAQPTNIVPTDTEDAIKYLKNFLDSYEKYGLEEDCLKSVSTVTNDLISKLSACTTKLKSHGAAARLENYNNVTEQPLIEKSNSTETQYKDLESTSNASPIQIKPVTQTKEVQSSLPTIEKPTQSEIQSFKEMGGTNRQNGYGTNETKTKENLSEQTTKIVPKVENQNVVQQQVQPQESLSYDAFSKEKDNYRCETTENYHYSESQTQSNLWETEENYEITSECLDNRAHSHPPEEYIDAQYMLDHPTAQYSDQSSKCKSSQCIHTMHPLPIINTSNDEEYYCLPECPETKYNNRSLPSPSRVSQKSCYNTTNSETSSRSLEAAPSELDLLPIKGILKPCRVTDTTTPNACDFESHKTTSSVNFQNEEQVKTHTASSLTYTLGHEQISQLNDENIDTLITKDDSQRPLRKQSKMIRSETTVKQPLFEDCIPADNYPIHCQSAQEILDENIPRFTHCPCMLDTYMKLLEIYCKDDDKFDFMKH